MNTKKSPTLIILVVLLFSILVYIVIKFWTFSKGFDNKVVTILSFSSAVIWWAILYWALHHTTFQITSFFEREKTKDSSPKKRFQGSVAIIYPTCNDLDESALSSCINQDYLNFHVYICDDSNENFWDKINKYEKLYPNCTVTRRIEKKGFKAGNINHAVFSEVNEDWICLTDSDQYLKPNFLSKLCNEIPENTSKIAFIQAKNCPRITNDLSLFQVVMKDEISLYYNRDLKCRDKFGFVPLLGHGALLNTKIFKNLNGFPELVSEDFAYALKISSNGYEGIYVENAESEEAYPYDFGAFLTRITKFSGASAELIRKFLLKFILSFKVTLVEKWDFIIMLLWYILMPLIVINGFISAYVTHFFWIQEVPYIHPILPYIYTYMLLTILIIILSIQNNSIRNTIKFYFWTSAVYSSILPISSFYFLKGLFIDPKFRITPKEKKLNRLNKSHVIPTTMLGIFGIVFSLIYWSPFSWFLLGHSVSYCIFPLLIHINNTKLKGYVIRSFLLYLPGALMIIALISLWSVII